MVVCRAAAAQDVARLRAELSACRAELSRAGGGDSGGALPPQTPRQSEPAQEPSSPPSGERKRAPTAAVVDAVPASSPWDSATEPELTLSLRTPAGKYEKLPASASERVAEVKGRAASALGVGASGRSLVFNFRVLDDSAKLGDCGVGDKAVVRLEVARARGKNVILASLGASRKSG